MDLICCFCNAKHFQSELTQNDSTSCISCGHKGKVFLLLLPKNIFFNNMFNQLNSNNSLEKRKSKKFFVNIRAFNSANAKVSSEAKIDTNSMQGAYHYNIHDVFYYHVGTLVTEYGRSSSYIQLYLYDDTAVNLRLSENTN